MITKGWWLAAALLTLAPSGGAAAWERLVLYPVTLDALPASSHPLLAGLPLVAPMEVEPHLPDEMPSDPGLFAAAFGYDLLVQLLAFGIEGLLGVAGFAAGFTLCGPFNYARAAPFWIAGTLVLLLHPLLDAEIVDTWLSKSGTSKPSYPATLAGAYLGMVVGDGAALAVPLLLLAVASNVSWVGLIVGPMIGSLVGSLITVRMAEDSSEPLLRAPSPEKLEAATGREAADLIAGPNASSLGSPTFVPALSRHF